MALRFNLIIICRYCGTCDTSGGNSSTSRCRSAGLQVEDFQDLLAGLPGLGSQDCDVMVRIYQE